MGVLHIKIADLRFRAGWETAAPHTVEAVRRLLPLDDRLIHSRWSGEATWIPLGDDHVDLGYENHTAHPAPGQLLFYPGGISEVELLLPYGSCSFSSKVGQLAGNQFAMIIPDEGWADRLREVGRRCLWEGAQPISIVELD
jgi:hypothetical protein